MALCGLESLQKTSGNRMTKPGTWMHYMKTLRNNIKPKHAIEWHGHSIFECPGASCYCPNHGISKHLLALLNVPHLSSLLSSMLTNDKWQMCFRMSWRILCKQTHADKWHSVFACHASPDVPSIFLIYCHMMKHGMILAYWSYCWNKACMAQHQY